MSSLVRHGCTVLFKRWSECTRFHAALAKEVKRRAASGALPSAAGTALPPSVTLPRKNYRTRDPVRCCSALPCPCALRLSHPPSLRSLHASFPPHEVSTASSDMWHLHNHVMCLSGFDCSDRSAAGLWRLAGSAGEAAEPAEPLLCRADRLGAAARDRPLAVLADRPKLPVAGDRRRFAAAAAAAAAAPPGPAMGGS